MTDHADIGHNCNPGHIWQKPIQTILSSAGKLVTQSNASQQWNKSNQSDQRLGFSHDELPLLLATAIAAAGSSSRPVLPTFSLLSQPATGCAKPFGRAVTPAVLLAGSKAPLCCCTPGKGCKPLGAKSWLPGFISLGSVSFPPCLNVCRFSLCMLDTDPVSHACQNVAICL